jgi:hypothetical protein
VLGMAGLLMILRCLATHSLAEDASRQYEAKRAADHREPTQAERYPLD